MQQTAPKFMAQVKARFVAAPNSSNTHGGSPDPHPQPQASTPQNRPQRVSSGGAATAVVLPLHHHPVGGGSKQVGNGGALSHRQMQLEPMMHHTNLSLKDGSGGGGTIRLHHTSQQ